jgi:formylglycine-generating enzyme required for sulfatase activity
MRSLVALCLAFVCLAISGCGDSTPETTGGKAKVAAAEKKTKVAAPEKGTKVAAPEKGADVAVPEKAPVPPLKVYTTWPFDAAEAKRRQEETAKALGVPVEEDIALGKGIKLTMVLIPAGEFVMGSPGKPTPERLAKLYAGVAKWTERERPQYRVRFTRPFWLGKTEVTQAQWQAVMGANPSVFQVPGNPVEKVRWEDCQTFLTRLNEKVVRRGVRLPTEAQWEYACRAGATTPFHFGNAREQLSDYAWWQENSERRTHPTGSRRPNPWGLHDLHGNVWEWCQDGWTDDPAGAQTDPAGPTGRKVRVLRGGSWCNAAFYCRSAYRALVTPCLRNYVIGFRVSRPVP